jgi:hypothetical protein
VESDKYRLQYSVRFRCERNTAWLTLLAADFYHCIAYDVTIERYFPSYFISPTPAVWRFDIPVLPVKFLPRVFVAATEWISLTGLVAPNSYRRAVYRRFACYQLHTQLSCCYLLAHTPNPGSQNTRFLRWCEILVVTFVD